MFRIVEAFLDAARDGHELTYELIMREAAPTIRSGEDLARYGAGVLARVDEWWAGCADRSGEGMMETYFGRHPMQVVLLPNLVQVWVITMVLLSSVGVSIWATIFLILCLKKRVSVRQEFMSI